MNKFDKHKKTIRAEILQLMRKDSDCRNSDKWLIYRFIRDVQGIKLGISFDEFKEIENFETIRRLRQHIQHTEQKLLPTNQIVREDRRISEYEWRNWLGKARYIWGLEE